jgi:hypothetical protein
MNIDNSSHIIRTHWLLCFPTRLAIAYLVLSRPEFSNFFGIMFAGIGLGFFFRWITDKNQIGLGFGGPVWWHHFRIIHGVMYLLASSALLIHQNTQLAATFLVSDLLVSVSSSIGVGR